MDRDAAEQQPEDASMNPHRPTAGNGVHRTAKLLFAMATAITLAVVIACSGNEPPPTDSPDRSQPQLEQTIEAMTDEITALQTETAESKGTANGDRETANTYPTPAMTTHNQSKSTNAAYARCLDEIYLRWARASDYGLPAVVWHCQHLEPKPYTGSSPVRCWIDESNTAMRAHEDWSSDLTNWYAAMACNTPPDIESSLQIAGGEKPSDYAACLDNKYITLAEQGLQNILPFIIWACREYETQTSPDNPPNCVDTKALQTKELFPEWPEDLHSWNAQSECRREWQPTALRDEYQHCLEDVYLKASAKERKSVAIPVAVWACRNHMPEPPEAMNPRCRTAAINRTKDADLHWPKEMHAWHAVATCYPKYSGT